jgi:DtxR family Mn-dependent transcriptional regulator
VAREDYLRAIYILQEVAGETGVTQIANRLGLSKSTVSERLKDLAAAGLVSAGQYTQVSLTKEGEKLGKILTHKHRIIEVFLNSVLLVPKDKVHMEAERLEHAVSDDVIQRLEKFLKYPTSDPHGSAIPKIDQWK